MEFLRFGSSIPGSYWGCCAVCIIQNFNCDPDAKASIQIVSGDGGGALMKDGKSLFAGPTYRDIFKTRIRIGTFSSGDMPNHGFLAVITANQCRGATGKKWLAILKEAGFEFIRAVDNSVYTGSAYLPEGTCSPHMNYVFGLFRTINHVGKIDPNAPPKEWDDLPVQTLSQDEIWRAGETKFYSEEELIEMKVPVTVAGLRSQYPQQLKSTREEQKAREALAIEGGKGKKASAFVAPEPEPEEADDDYDDEYFYEDNDYCGNPDCDICGG